MSHWKEISNINARILKATTKSYRWIDCHNPLWFLDLISGNSIFHSPHGPLQTEAYFP